MSEVIDFLERVGTNAALRRVMIDAPQSMQSGSDLTAAAWVALMSQDRRALEDLLGAQANICCGLHPAEDDDEDTEEDEGKEEDEEREDDVKSYRVAAVA